MVKKGLEVAGASFQRQEAVYRSVLESCADAIAIYDIQGRAHYLNPSFTETFGWRMKDLEQGYIPFVPPSERALTDDIIRRAVEDGEQAKGVRTKRFTRDGRLREVDISVSRYSDHAGAPAGLLIIHRDNTHARELEVQLLQSQKMEAIGTLAGGMAHDINNILMGIQGRVSLMQDEPEGQASYHEHLASIKTYIRRASDLTKQLLGFARGGKYEVKITNLNDLILKSSETFGRTKKEIRIRIKAADQLWHVEIDIRQIEQVLLNLYVNAWQAMPEGGDLYLHTENVVIEDDFAKRHQVLAGRYVKASVTDTGVGIEPSLLQKIFDPFFTTKGMGRGTGLGLASVYGIIRNHKGIITVQSELGHGAAFSIYLPAVSPKNVVKPHETPSINDRQSVLLLDDEKMVLDVGQPMLEKIGYEVFVAASGPEALDIYQQHRSMIRLVIIDLIMPEMSGGQVYDELKKIDPDVKVLLSSGYSINGEAQKILARGCNGFIQKPFGIRELSRKIGSILDG